MAYPNSKLPHLMSEHCLIVTFTDNNGAVELQEVGNNLPIEPAEPNAPANGKKYSSRIIPNVS